MTCKELELFTDIHDFTTLCCVILRHKSCERLDSSIKSDVISTSMQYGALNQPFMILLSSNTLSSVRTVY